MKVGHLIHVRERSSFQLAPQHVVGIQAVIFSLGFGKFRKGVWEENSINRLPHGLTLGSIHSENLVTLVKPSQNFILNH